MTIDSGRSHLSVRGIPVEVIRKAIKNLHLGVYPPHGRVRVASPLHLDDDAVRLAIVSRLGWIRRKQAEFQQQQRQSRREFVNGESHYFAGRRYRLHVTQESSRPSVRLLNNTTMALRIPPGAGWRTREAVLNRWYRRQLREQLPVLVAAWEPKVGVRVDEVRIRRMKTLWGSCNPDAKRIWLNLELAKKPISCLTYVLVHEMIHLIERRHSDRFYELMSQFMPQWRLHRDELNRVPLAHADWKY